MQIILIRHGQPKFTFPTWVNGDAFWRCIMAYQRSELCPTSWPPAPTKALTKALIQNANGLWLTSDLPRAAQSARRLQPLGPITHSSRFREPEFEQPKLPKVIPLPFWVWALMARIQRRLDALIGTGAAQTRHAHILTATHYLIEQASRVGSVALVGHSITHRLIAQELRRLGWQGPRVPYSIYWGCSLYTCSEPTVCLAQVHDLPQPAPDIFGPVEESEVAQALIQGKDNFETSLGEVLRRDRKFSLAEAIGREGADFLKGESTIPRPLRAIAHINLLIAEHLQDAQGALEPVLKTWIKTDVRVSQHLDEPATALHKILASILDSEEILSEFSRQVNVQWGEIYGERPHFQTLGQPPHPQTAYTHATVRKTLLTLLTALTNSQP
ncbi:MAG: hypothetical protein AAGF01_24895 [Cyanobacteria bacterium P01_G01_bin.38]